MSEGDGWVAKIRRIHDENFAYAWDEHLNRLNSELCLPKYAYFQTPAPGLPPVWTNGNIEALESDHWVLVISLNPGLGGKPGNTQPAVPDQHSTPEGRWEFMLTFNRDHWYSRFFSPLVRVARGALGEKADAIRECDFATDRMLFIEICPYASHNFSLSWKQVGELAATDCGFRIAREVQQIALREGRPALVLVNGNQAVSAVGSDGDLKPSWSRVDYPSESRPEKCLHHWEGTYDTPYGSIPIAGFPFLRTRAGFNSNAEIAQLANRLRDLVVRTGQASNNP